MTKEELMTILGADENTLTELTEDKVYLFQIEVGDMPKEEVMNYLTRIRQAIGTKIDISKILFVPMHNGLGKITVEELKELE